MAQLYFRYSTMNAGKSTEILKIAHNYEEQNKKAGELVAKILQEHQVTPLDEAIVRRGDEIIEAFEKKCAE